MRHYQALSSRVLAVELLMVAGPISVVVSYAPTEQSSVEEKDQFYSDLDYAMGSACKWTCYGDGGLQCSDQ